MPDATLRHSGRDPYVMWQPYGGERHAYRPDFYADGAEVGALCGAEIVIRRGLDELTWLAPTCEPCMREAWALVVGTPYPLDEDGGQA